MSSAKPLDVAVLSKVQGSGTRDLWKAHQEYGEKTNGSTKEWSSFILAKEGEQFSIRCTNTTEKILAVRISVDSCYVQQYLLRPKGKAGDTVVCLGTGSHAMMFHLVSTLTRAGNKHSRPPSETGCISVTVYTPTGSGSGLPPPEKPTEQLELPVSMDGTFWKLCVRLTGNGLVIGEPSPHAAVIGVTGWRQLATLNFNYRTEDELFSGRIRGIPITQKQGALADASPLSLSRKRKSTSAIDVAPKKRRDQSPLAPVWRKPVTVHNAVPGTSNQQKSGTSTISPVVTKRIEPIPIAVPKVPADLDESPSHKDRSPPASPDPKPESHAAVVPSSGSAVMDLDQTPFVAWPPDPTPRSDSNVPDGSPRRPASQPSTELSSNNPPAVPAIELGPPQPQSEPSLVAPTITPPLTHHDNLGLEKSAAASTDEVDRVVSTLTTFLNEACPTPLGFLVGDLQKAGISTITELKAIARKPEVFRMKIPVLADLRENEEFLWLTFRMGLRKLMEEDQQEQSANSMVLESDPVKKFIRSLGGIEPCIDLEEVANGLKGAGISSERDLLVLARNLEKYTEKIPFLREFAASKKFGWMLFQVGLEDLSGQKASTSIQAQDRGTDREGEAYIKQFLDTIDPDKPLGHLAGGFIKAGLTSHARLFCIAENPELALDAMPFLQSLASGDQLVWAMISVGLSDLKIKPA